MALDGVHQTRSQPKRCGGLGSMSWKYWVTIPIPLETQKASTIGLCKWPREQNGVGKVMRQISRKEDKSLFVSALYPNVGLREA